jgi:branched-chain amino acid transport system substrate-binding protein
MYSTQSSSQNQNQKPQINNTWTFAKVKKIGFLATGLALSALLVACNNVPDVMKIGVAQPLSGNLAPLGNDLLNGVKLAVDELNKAGFKVKGKPVTLEIVAVDDRADAKVGVEVAKQLVDAGVVAVIGHLNSGVSIPAAPIYAEKGIAQLAISTNVKYTALGLPTTFRIVANDGLQAKALGSYAAQLNGSKFALFNDGTPYGKDLAAGAEQQLKVSKKAIAFTQTFDDKTTAFDGLAEKLKAENIDTLVATLNDFQLLALLKSLQKINYTTISILGGDLIKTSDMLKGAGIVSGLYASSPVIEAVEFPAGNEFVTKYVAAFKIQPAYGGHYTYDATHALAAAIRNAGSANPAEIAKSLRKIDAYTPVTGSMKFDDKGDQRYGAIAIYSINAGKWESQIRSDNW